MPNGFTALATLNGASTAATSTTGATPVFTTAATTTPGTSASPTTALASQSASSGILRYPLDSATYYLALFIYSYVAPSVQSSATATWLQTIGLPEPMKMIDAQSIELNANHRSFVVQMAQQIYSQLAGVACSMQRIPHRFLVLSHLPRQKPLFRVRNNLEQDWRILFLVVLVGLSNRRWA